MEIVEFLLARIAEDEAVATAATAGPWVPDSQGWTDAEGDPFIRAPYHDLDISSEDAEHITRWLPARVLAECEAKRRIMTEAQRYDDENAVRADDFLRPLAAPYADHPDYDREWKP